MWKCPKCGEVSQIMLAIGDPTCNKDGTQLVPMNVESESTASPMPISVGGKVTVGGSVDNVGKIKVFPNGELNVQKDLINRGDLVINDTEKIILKSFPCIRK